MAQTTNQEEEETSDGQGQGRRLRTEQETPSHGDKKKLFQAAYLASTYLKFIILNWSNVQEDVMWLAKWDNPLEREVVNSSLQSE